MRLSQFNAGFQLVSGSKNGTEPRLAAHHALVGCQVWPQGRRAAPLLRRELKVVTPAHINGPASTAESASGIAANVLAGATIYSA
jgi:hypothetical protein